MAKLDALFNPRYTFTVHVVQIILILIVFILSIVRISMTEVPITRANIMGIPISIKSLIILAYQLLTEHSARFSKWASLMANMILNIIEVLFWAVLMGLVFQANARICIGASCAVTWVTGILCLTLMLVGAWVAVVSVLNWRYFKRYHVRRGSKPSPLGDQEAGHPANMALPRRPYK